MFKVRSKSDPETCSAAKAVKQICPGKGLEKELHTSNPLSTHVGKIEIRKQWRFALIWWIFEKRSALPGK